MTPSQFTFQKLQKALKILSKNPYKSLKNSQKIEQTQKTIKFDKKLQKNRLET
jgi:hypothetical protein